MNKEFEKATKEFFTDQFKEDTKEASLRKAFEIIQTVFKTTTDDKILMDLVEVMQLLAKDRDGFINIADMQEKYNMSTADIEGR